MSSSNQKNSKSDDFYPSVFMGLILFLISFIEFCKVETINFMAFPLISFISGVLLIIGSCKQSRVLLALGSLNHISKLFFWGLFMMSRMSNFFRHFLSNNLSLNINSGWPMYPLFKNFPMCDFLSQNLDQNLFLSLMGSNFMEDYLMIVALASSFLFVFLYYLFWIAGLGVIVGEIISIHLKINEKKSETLPKTSADVMKGGDNQMNQNKPIVKYLDSLNSVN